MTVSSTTNTVSFVGDGVVTEFDFTFRVDDEDHMEVSLTEIASGAQGDALDPALYTVTLDGEDGGTVTYPLTGSPLAATHKINLRRVVPYAQSLDLTRQSGYDPSELERQLDLTTMQVQQLNEQISRAVLTPLGSGISDTELIDAIIGMALGLPVPRSGGGTGVAAGSLAAMLSGIGLGTEDSPEFTQVVLQAANIAAQLDAWQIAKTGTWTPAPQFGGAAVGMTGSFTGFWRRIRGLMWCEFNCVFTAKGSSTGTFTLGGMPYAVSTGYGAPLKACSGMASLNMIPVMNPQFNTVTARLSQLNGGSTGSADLTHANFTDTTEIYGTVVYATGAAW